MVIEAGVSITLKCGASLIHMNQAGFILIQGTLVHMIGSIHANVAAPLTTVEGVGMFTTGALTVSTGVVNKVIGGISTVSGNPVKINC